MPYRPSPGDIKRFQEFDAYAALGVSRAATPEEIKKAHRTMVKQFHSDLHPGDEVAAKKFREAVEAYVIFSDPEKLAVYLSIHDERIGLGFGSVRGQNGRVWNPFGNPFEDVRAAGGANFADFFEDLFGKGVRINPRDFMDAGFRATDPFSSGSEARQRGRTVHQTFGEQVAHLKFYRDWEHLIEMSISAGKLSEKIAAGKAAVDVLREKGDHVNLKSIINNEPGGFVSEVMLYARAGYVEVWTAQLREYEETGDFESLIRMRDSDELPE
ncbi:MAG: DnaJ domain-containing protein, partial [Candidatus Micrarchaeia archaeon]